VTSLAWNRLYTVRKVRDGSPTVLHKNFCGCRKARFEPGFLVQNPSEERGRRAKEAVRFQGEC
jgi:hypothetical protein